MSFFEFPHTRTYDSDLGWLIRTVKQVTEIVDSMEDWRIQHESEYEELKSLYDDIMSGHFPDSISNAFNQWMIRNGQGIIANMIKMVFFGLTDDGYFVAYIPDSWREIIFNTSGLDITIDDVDYGHLILSY